MPYQREEERAKLGQKLSKEAIALAIQGRWEEAVAVNKKVVENFPTDVEAYNRLGRALTELGDFKEAKGAYLQALELAPDNAIAKKNLARLENLSTSITSGGEHRPSVLRAQTRAVAPELFAAEMGKSGVVNLCHAASAGELLARTGYGEQVQLKVKGKELVVENNYGEYLGEVEAKHALRLIKLIEGGNRYAAAIFRIKEQGQPLHSEVQVLIKEIYHDPSQAGHLSFPPSLLNTTKKLKRSDLTCFGINEGSPSKKDEETEGMGRPEEEIENSEDDDGSLHGGFSPLDKERELMELEE